MNILVLGGTRYFGVHLVNQLLGTGSQVTIGTRGKQKDNFGNQVSRLVFDRTREESVEAVLKGKEYDVIFDNTAYSSVDVKYVLDRVGCKKYILMSSTAVYEPKHVDTREEEFNPMDRELIWCTRGEYPYDELKRQAECALYREYADVNSIMVRYPFVIGKDDYTKRLLFYVEHAMKKIPMNIDNYDAQMSYISSREAGNFLAFLADKNYSGPINGCLRGTISIKEILEYVFQKTGKRPVVNPAGEAAPYNHEPEYSICTERAETLGYTFSSLHEEIYELLDYYIGELQKDISPDII